MCVFDKNLLAYRIERQRRDARSQDTAQILSTRQSSSDDDDDIYDDEDNNDYDDDDEEGKGWSHA